MSKKTITDKLNDIVKSSNEQVDFFKRKIVELDNEKTDYDQAIVSIDRSVFDDLESVNDKLLAVQNAYQTRVNVGCRTDLFWRWVGISTLGTPPAVFTYNTYRCEKLNPNGYDSAVGLGSTDQNKVIYIKNTSGDEDTENLNSLFGLEQKNLYGIKFYDEPYARDITNSFVSGFIGTIALLSNKLVVMDPVGNGATTGISTGQLIYTSESGVFPTETVVITGIGTTIADLSKVGFGTTSTNVVVGQLTLDTNALKTVKAPKNDGSYVQFKVLKSPSELTGIGIPITSNPYSPQSIGIIDSESELGIGVKVEYDNSGNPRNTKSWRPEFEGVKVDENGNPKASGTPLQQPSVGAGKIFYTLGFTSKPQKYSGSWVDAEEGDEATFIAGFGYGVNIRNTSLSSCATEQADLDSKITIADQAESDVASASSDITKKLEISSVLREERSKYNIQIWGKRQLLSELQKDKNKVDIVKNALNDSVIVGILT